MRDALAILEGERITVRATVLRRSKRPGWAGVDQATLLLGHITSLDGAPLCDHLWLDEGKRLAALALQPGDVLAFSGRVRRYRRRCAEVLGDTADGASDYGLRYPTACLLLTRALDAPPRAHGAAPSTNAGKTLALIAQLSHEAGESPSLVKLCFRSSLPPWQVLHSLHQLAKAHTIQFSPAGHIVISQEEVYAS